jgi:hypothetical protein
MLIKHSDRGRNRNPRTLSDYDRTYNRAIDLVTEAIGHANKVETRMVAAVRLKPTFWRLFVDGMRILMAQKGVKLEDATEFTLEGYKVLEGPRRQYNSIEIEYVENALNPKLFN